eukprot:gene4-4_t
MSVHSEYVRDPNSMDFMVHEPIRSGFLLKYCNAHFCSENMRFVVEVDRFRDLFHVDKSSWPSRKHWKQIDLDHNLVTPEVDDFNPERDFLIPLREGRFFNEDAWPSKRLPLVTVRSSVEFIWSEYLAENAPYWICIPLKILVNTVKRLKLIHVYGREVFSEALLDPVKTIQRDIQPRFLASEDYRNLRQLLNSLDPLPCAQSLKLPKPPHVIYSRYDMRTLESGEARFTMDDLIDDRILFPEFLKYLEQCVSSENLRCMRAIQVYKEARGSSDNKEQSLAVDYAWTIYKFFVAPGSAYGISISHRRLKEVMRALASPNLNTFEAVEQSALSALKVHFDTYKTTKEYSQLYKIVLSRKDSGVLAAIASPVREVTASSESKKQITPSLSSIIRNTCFPGI